MKPFGIGVLVCRPWPMCVPRGRLLVGAPIAGCPRTQEGVTVCLGGMERSVVVSHVLDNWVEDLPRVDTDLLEMLVEADCLVHVLVEGVVWRIDIDQPPRQPVRSWPCEVLAGPFCLTLDHPIPRYLARPHLELE